jgi:hypothetical protein
LKIDSEAASNYSIDAADLSAQAKSTADQEAYLEAVPELGHSQ